MTDSVQVALIATAGPTIVGILVYLRAGLIHTVVNGNHEKDAKAIRKLLKKVKRLEAKIAVLEAPAPAASRR
jgi:hypothetical protein